MARFKKPKKQVRKDFNRNALKTKKDNISPKPERGGIRA